MDYLYLKAIHVTFAVCWFAGLFYIVRLYIYQTEAQETDLAKRNPDLIPQYQLMQRRLWFGITQPAMILTLTFGIWLLLQSEVFFLSWFRVKDFFLVALLVYHFYCGSIRKRLAKGVYPHSSRALRFFNEGATILLVGIVFTVVVKQPNAFIYGLSGLFVLGIAILLVMRFVRRSQR